MERTETWQVDDHEARSYSNPPFFSKDLLPAMRPKFPKQEAIAGHRCRAQARREEQLRLPALTSRSARGKGRASEANPVIEEEVDQAPRTGASATRDIATESEFHSDAFRKVTTSNTPPSLIQE
jgi:hypothetical protein